MREPYLDRGRRVVEKQSTDSMWNMERGAAMYLLNHPIGLFFVVAVVLLLAHECGFRLRVLAKNREDKEWEKQVHDTRNQIAVALSRFDERKQLVIDEANAIGTAYLRASMQAEPIRSTAPALLRDYVDSRIAIFGSAAEEDERNSAAQHSRKIQDQLWSDVTTQAQQSPTPIVAIYVSALNDMIDLDGKRVAARLNRIPLDIWMLLGTLSILTSVVIGYGQRRRAALATFVPVLMVAIAVSLIADLDSPVTGLIQVSQQSMQTLSTDLHMQLSVAGDAGTH
jgi:predicted membrane protein